MVSDLSGTLYVVATPIGHLDDISRRALDTLKAVDLIAVEDTRHTGRLLARYGIRQSMSAYHDHNERDMTSQLVARLKAGANIALVSDAGTPLISDPGYALVHACRAQGLAVVSIPGPSALVAALSVSGLPTDRFRFEGFLPRKTSARRAHLRSLTEEYVTIVVYEASHRIRETMADLCDVFGNERAAVVARELTKLHESLLSAPLGDLRKRIEADANQRKGEFVILIAGAPAPSTEALAGDIERMLRILLAELPVKQAASLAARLTGLPKNQLYRHALELSRT